VTGGKQRRAAVIGSPVAHSLSPALHRAAYAALDLDWTYDAIDVEDPQLADFIDGLDEAWRGLSLTMPLKRVVLALLDETSPVVDVTRAANTVVFQGRRRLGDNTDVHGIVAAIREAELDRLDTVTNLGGGATATSALAAVHELGVTAPRVVVRSKERSADMLTAADRLAMTPSVHAWPGEPAVWETDLVLSTVPSGGADTAVGQVGAGTRAVFDVVYDPWPTPLAAAAAAAGCHVIGGLEMLVHQAARQVELMTGLPAPVATMRAAGQAALTGR
jgi:shikimate dehydrogenase